MIFSLPPLTWIKGDPGRTVFRDLIGSSLLQGEEVKTEEISVLV